MIKQRTHHAITATMMLVMMGCSATGTEPTHERPSPYGGNHGYDIILTGTSITATGGADTISIDRAAHTLIANQQQVILTQEFADSLFALLESMKVAEDQVKLVQSGGVVGGGVPLVPGDVPQPTCSGGQILCTGVRVQGNDNRSSALTKKQQQEIARNAIQVSKGGHVEIPRSQHPSGGAAVRAGTMAIGAGAALTKTYDLGISDFTCEDAGLAIYNEMPNYNRAKRNVLALLGLGASAAIKDLKNLPQLPSYPATWFGEAVLLAYVPALDLAFAEFTTSRNRLNYFATEFSAMGCFQHDPSVVSGGGGSGSGGTGGGTEHCYFTIYYYVDTYEVIDIVPLGCW